MTVNISKRIASRIRAEELLSLAEFDDCVDPRVFWETVRDAALKHAPLPPAAIQQVEPMTDQQSREFGKESMPFGVHQGQRIDSVDISYLVWLSDTQSAFSRQLRSYLASERIKTEVEAL